MDNAAGRPHRPGDAAPAVFPIVRFLVLNHAFRGCTGSEINALQLCEALRTMGHEADVGTFEPGRPLTARAERSGITVRDLLEEDDTPLDYDLVWAHHAPVLTYLLFRRRLRDCRLLFSSLSPLTAMESPPAFLGEISRYLVHSPYNRDHLRDLGIPADRIRYFPNFAPEAFFAHPRPAPPRRLATIAIVSHHPPDEVKRFALLARRRGMRVDYIGEPRPVYIDETVLPAYDLVVSIGRTAQYCFAQRVPFYCYDHFGGPGYITSENFERAQHGNFCGRSFWRKLTAAGLYQEITHGYAAAVAGLDGLRARARSLFHLETNLAALISELPALPVTDFAALRARHPVAGRLNDIYLESLRNRLRYERTLCSRLRQPLRRLKLRWDRRFPGRGA